MGEGSPSGRRGRHFVERRRRPRKRRDPKTPVALWMGPRLGVVPWRSQKWHFLVHTIVKPFPIPDPSPPSSRTPIPGIPPDRRGFLNPGFSSSSAQPSRPEAPSRSANGEPNKNALGAATRRKKRVPPVQLGPMDQEEIVMEEEISVVGLEVRAKIGKLDLHTLHSSSRSEFPRRSESSAERDEE